MSASAPAPQAPVTRVWPLYRAMVGIGLGCGILIVGVYQWTLPVIARNRAEALERAIFDVLPAAETRAAWRWSEGGGFEPAPEGEGGEGLVHAGYDASGALVGVAVEARSMGYADVIRLLYGYAPSRDAVIGIRVLESRETPGLGDRIETDPGFLANFEALDVSLGPGGDAIAHPIEGVKQGEKEHPWQVDGITGATISAMAVADALAQSTAVWVPRVHGAVDVLQQGPRP